MADETTDADVLDVAAAIEKAFMEPSPEDWNHEARAAIAAYQSHLIAKRGVGTPEWVRTAEQAIRANRAEESHQRALTERNSNRMEADRIAAEMYRVRDALGVGPGGADLGLQVRDALAERNARIAELEARDAAWKAYAADLERRLAQIGGLAYGPASKGRDLDHDTVVTIDRLTDTPPLPAVLAETPAPTTEGDQT